MNPRKKTVAIIGSGPAALMLAAHLNEHFFEVKIFEKNAAAGRKFLVAGDGGFNLTHSENMDTLVQRYTPAAFLENSLRGFTNEELRKFLLGIGIPTFTGTSGRVFPEKGIKPIEVLNAFLRLLEKKKVQFFFRHEWKGWENDQLVFYSGEEKISVQAGYTVFALGGASWSVTGSDGKWTSFFSEKGIRLLPFRASNCAVTVEWPETLLKEAEGEPLKNIAVRCGETEKRGEIVITKNGLEGGAVYFHSPCIRGQLDENGKAMLLLDLRPDLTAAEIQLRLENETGKSRIDQLKKLGLGKGALSLLRTFTGKDDFFSNPKMAGLIKAFPVTVTGTAPIEEAISTAGGIAPEEVSADFELKKLPHHFAIGEMLSWDAPTGGYLLQACFSMGFKLAQALNADETQKRL